jgi:hypothetical protein
MDCSAQARLCHWLEELISRALPKRLWQFLHKNTNGTSKLGAVQKRVCMQTNGSECLG